MINQMRFYILKREMEASKHMREERSAEGLHFCVVEIDEAMGVFW